MLNKSVVYTHSKNGARARALPPTYIEIDLDAIAHNVGALKAQVGPDVALIAVVARLVLIPCFVNSA